jgi:NADPH:quinone reductase-like Zn-dependent oxidoreductase
VLVQAAGSGVGTAAASMAAVAGARVVALSRSAEKRRRLLDLGAHHVFDPTAANVAEAIRMATGGDGIRVVLDLVGASAWALNVEVLASLGRIVLVGTMSGSKAEADLSSLMHQRVTVVGTVLRSRPIEEKIALVQTFSRTMLPLLAAGRLNPVVDRIVPFEEAAEAHAAMERNENFGKIVLTVS